MPGAGVSFYSLSLIIKYRQIKVNRFKLTKPIAKTTLLKSVSINKLFVPSPIVYRNRWSA
jgi:hypothetical protein